MSDEQLIRKTADYVKKTLSDDATGHDWWHIARVWELAKRIGHEEHADMLVVELGALLHDIADWKFTEGDLEVGPQVAGEWLKGCGADANVIENVQDIVRNISFKGAKVKIELNSLEAKIVFDADKLDAIGAIGIARTFVFGGSIKQPLYIPGHKPKLHESFEDYSKFSSHNLNHFYEKLLLLKDLMHTQTARQMAERRHKFMEEFLEEFYAEWDGKR